MSQNRGRRGTKRNNEWAITQCATIHTKSFKNDGFRPWRGTLDYSDGIDTTSGLFLKQIKLYPLLTYAAQDYRYYVMAQIIDYFILYSKVNPLKDGGIQSKEPLQQQYNKWLENKMKGMGNLRKRATQAVKKHIAVIMEYEKENYKTTTPASIIEDRIKQHSVHMAFHKLQMESVYNGFFFKIQFDFALKISEIMKPSNNENSKNVKKRWQPLTGENEIYKDAEKYAKIETDAGKSYPFKFLTSIDVSQMEEIQKKYKERREEIQKEVTTYPGKGYTGWIQRPNDDDVELTLDINEIEDLVLSDTYEVTLQKGLNQGKKIVYDVSTGKVRSADSRNPVKSVNLQIVGKNEDNTLKFLEDYIAIPESAIIKRGLNGKNIQTKSFRGFPRQSKLASIDTKEELPRQSEVSTSIETKEEMPRQSEVSTSIETKEEMPRQSEVSTSIEPKEEMPRQSEVSTSIETKEELPRQSRFGITQAYTPTFPEDTQVIDTDVSRQSFVNANPFIKRSSEPRANKILPKNTTEFERYVPQEDVLCENGQVLPKPPTGFSYIKIKDSDICDIDNYVTTQSTEKPIVVSDDNLTFKVYYEGVWYEQEVGAVDSYLKNVLPLRR
jgi:hypothetical protein